MTSEQYTQEQYEQFRREQDAKAAQEAQARQERIEKETARRAWIADGGNEAGFQHEWPKLRDEGRRRRVADADLRDRARREKPPQSTGASGDLGRARAPVRRRRPSSALTAASVVA